jgi:hypothetical protein
MVAIAYWYVIIYPMMDAPMWMTVWYVGLVVFVGIMLALTVGLMLSWNQIEPKTRFKWIMWIIFV